MNESDLRITKVSFYEPIEYDRRLIAQSRGIIEIETNSGIVGIGEGGTPDLVADRAAFLIGQDPLRIEHLWQLMFRGDFYPAGRELAHAIGGLDIALWDIKGKVLNAPVYQMMGGKYRNYINCYATGYGRKESSARDAARRCVEEGFIAYRTGGFLSDLLLKNWDPLKAHREIYKHCKEVAEGVGSEGHWAIDFHTRLDPPQAVKLAHLIEDLDPLFCEDLVRSENLGYYETIRHQVRVPLAVGEQLGVKWEISDLIEKNLIDYSRATLPNVGGLTEMKKIMALMETHNVGMIPHFTGPISLAAQVHLMLVYTGITIQEIATGISTEIPYLNEDYIDFHEGKLYPNDRPGIGVELDKGRLEKKVEVTEPNPHPLPVLFRPDGSYTNW